MTATISEHKAAANRQKLATAIAKEAVTAYLAAALETLLRERDEARGALNHSAHCEDKAKEERNRAEARAESAEAQVERMQEALGNMSKPILWSEIREVSGKNGDPIDFSGLEVQSAACTILRNRHARAALEPTP